MAVPQPQAVEREPDDSRQTVLQQEVRMEADSHWMLFLIEREKAEKAIDTGENWQVGGVRKVHGVLSGLRRSPDARKQRPQGAVPVCLLVVALRIVYSRDRHFCSSCVTKN
jgi:hypothetical protein